MPYTVRTCLVHVLLGYATLLTARAVDSHVNVKARDVGPYTLHIEGFGGNKTLGFTSGIMFEDINHSGDGGLYAELIQNRAFQGAVTPDPWVGINGATLTLDTFNPLSSALPTSVAVTPAAGSTIAGLYNPGWWGISVTPQTYTGSFYVSGTYDGDFMVTLSSALNSVSFASATIAATSSSQSWTQVNYTLIPAAAAPNVNNILAITFTSQQATDGSLNFNLISLFPETYNNHTNGNRVGLMQAMADIQPGFFRFPGGNNMQGGTNGSHRWIWSDTIGPLINRPGRLGDWTYWNTDGLGLNEYLTIAQDLGMIPLLDIWAGKYLNDTYIAQDDLQPYVDDAMNELEYILGDASTTYGALRASHGYPDPWNVTWVEIGNEDYAAANVAEATYANYRFWAFYDAIIAAYPSMNIVSSTQGFNYPSNVYGDVHWYINASTLISYFTLYDSNPSLLILSEYACSVPPTPTPLWSSSIAESIYLLGAERNADRIYGAAYAPMLQNSNPGSSQSTPSMVNFTADPGDTVLSTSYSTVQLLNSVRIVQTRPVLDLGGMGFGPLYYVGGEDGIGNYVVKMAVYDAGAPMDVVITMDGVVAGNNATLTVLSGLGGGGGGGGDGDIGNTVGDDVVSSVQNLIAADGMGRFVFTLADYSVAVLETIYWDP